MITFVAVCFVFKTKSKREKKIKKKCFWNNSEKQKRRLNSEKKLKKSALFKLFKSVI